MYLYAYAVLAHESKLRYTSKVNRYRATTSNLASNIILGVLGTYLAVSLFTTIRRNYQLQREIAQIEVSNKQLEQSNLDLQYRIAYFQTELYKDKAARAKLGLQAPGESVIILPKKPDTKVAANTNKHSRSNFAQWIDFLRGITP